MTDPTTDHVGLRLRRIPVVTRDPFSDDDRAWIDAEVLRLARNAAEFYGDRSGASRVRRTGGDGATNPATAELHAVPGFDHWISQVPTAAALHPLYDPDTTHYLTGRALTAEVRPWFRNLADARGIRSRAAVMESLLVEGGAAHPGSPRWLSLACGAAQPVVSAMAARRAAHASLPHVTLADLDRGALAMARRYAAARGVETSVTTVRRNVLSLDGFAGRPPRRLRRPAPEWRDAFDAVDAVGILEYLRPDDWTYTYRGVVTTRQVLAGAVTLVRHAWACVRPGGVLLLGNMLDTHPQLSFTLDVVQWPHIQPRSVEEMADILSAAGLEGEVDVHLPDDGVYAIYAVRKPS